MERTHFMQYTGNIKVTFEANSEEEAKRKVQQLAQVIHSANWEELPNIAKHLKTIDRKAKYLRRLKLVCPRPGVQVNKAAGFIRTNNRRIAEALHVNLG
jgi:hypothetical protein